MLSKSIVDAANSPKRTLLVKLRHYGDVLLTTPLIDALHHYFPDIVVDVLVYRETLDMLCINPQVTQCFTIDRRWKKQSVLTQFEKEWQLLRMLRARRYDTLIHLTESWRGVMLARLLGAERRIAFAYPRRDSWCWRTSFTDLIPLPQQPTHNVALQLSVLTTWGIAPDVARFPLHLSVDKLAEKSLLEALRRADWQGEPYILVHPGARWFFKCWEDVSFAKVIDALTDRGLSVVVTGAPDAKERAMAENILSRVRGRNKVYTLVGALSLTELAAAIGKAKLFIGVDSAPMHMAAARQIPGVVLFGPSKVHEWSPWQAPITVLKASDWTTLPHPDEIDTNTQTRYLSAIPTSAVIEAVLEKL
ncbi:MAG: putative lipopolysaccharide heptosyltransferase III [Burkholderiales bacterium]|jgi:heptosyltransferase-3|nr:putative lipopolysaccharide heptosyltransferase III [Burkholderiales bacterium]